MFVCAESNNTNCIELEHIRTYIFYVYTTEILYAMQCAGCNN